MRALDRRLNKLEYDFGVRQDTPRLRVVVYAAAKRLALDYDACLRILEEAGFLSPSGLAMVNFCAVPDGMNAEETKTYLRENGDQICYPRLPNNENGSLYDRRD